MSSIILRLELRRSRSLALGLLAVTILYGGLVGAIYPILRDNARLLDEYMAVFPKAVLAAFGMTGSLADHGVFFNTYIGSMLWPIVAAMAAGVLGTRTVAADLDRGFIELPLATRIDRIRYLGAAIAGQAVVMAGLAIATVGAVLGLGSLVGAGFDPARFLLEIPLLFVFGCALAGISTLLSVLTLSRGVSAGIVAGGLLAMYLLDAVSQLETSLDWLGVLSPFRYVRTTETIDGGLLPIGALAMFAAIAVATWGLALWVFRRRDLVA